MAALALACASAASAQEFRIQDVPSLAGLGQAALKSGMIAFSDQPRQGLADAETGLIPFDAWARAMPRHKAALGLHPAYVEPTIEVTVNGLTKPYKEKLGIYLAEARFLIDRPPAAIDLSRYVRLDFVQKLDPSIAHRQIGAAEAKPQIDPQEAHNRHPERRWCEAPGTLCIASKYQLEGKLPAGIRLANKLDAGEKKISEFLEFQSELRVLPPQDIARADLGKLTGIDAPVVGALEQSLFHVNQVMQFGKLLAVLQADPAAPGKTVVSVYMLLAVERDVLDKKKEFDRVPVLRNLVPAQVLMGQSSFNAGNSISAGLPKYTRNRIRAVAELLAR